MKDSSDMTRQTCLNVIFLKTDLHKHSYGRKMRNQIEFSNYGLCYLLLLPFSLDQEHSSQLMRMDLNKKHFSSKNKGLVNDFDNGYHLGEKITQCQQAAIDSLNEIYQGWKLKKNIGGLSFSSAGHLSPIFSIPVPILPSM